MRERERINQQKQILSIHEKININQKMEINSLNIM